MAFTPKDWVTETNPIAPPSNPATATPISGEALEDLETRLSDYTDAIRPNIFNVKKHGATGDGVADDTAEIQSAINAAAVDGGVVVFPIGRYLISSTLTLKYGVHLIAEQGGVFDESAGTDYGVTIVLANAANCDMVVNDPAAPIRPGQDNLHRWQRSRIEGITFGGNWTAQTTKTNAIFRFTKAWSIQLKGVTANEAAGYCIYLDDCNEIHASDCSFLNATKSPVYFDTAADCDWSGIQAGGGYESALVLDAAFGNRIDGMFYNSNWTASTLSSGITDAVTTIPVASSFYYPEQGGTVLIDSEQITFTGKATGQLTGCTRGVNGTTAAAHSSGAMVHNYTDHANGVHLINAATGNFITGRSDQNYQRGLYVGTDCDSNYIDLMCITWGQKNETGQSAIYLDGQYNWIGGVAYRHGIVASSTGNNMTGGIELGTDAFANTVVTALDSSLTQVSGAGSTSNQNMLLRGVTYLFGNLNVNGLISQASTTDSYIEQREMNTGPSAPSGVFGSRTYTDNDGPGGTARLKTIFPDGTIRTLAGESIKPQRGNILTGGQETLIRTECNNGAISMATGNMRWTCFDARKSETITALAVRVGSTAAGATPTLVRFGLYTVDSSDNLTLVASTANDTSLLAVANARSQKALSSSYDVVEGTRYAFAVLVVTAATAPVLLGFAGGNSAEMGVAPRISGLVGGQTDLPASLTVTTSHDNASAIYGVLVP